MAEKNIFEVATREKFRFQSIRGELTVEQLWDMQLLARQGDFDLDNIAKKIFTNLKSMEEESFVRTRPNPKKAVEEMKLEIVKHIIRVKQDEKAIAKAAADRAERRNQLMKALAEKENEELENKTKAEIIKELEELGG